MDSLGVIYLIVIIVPIILAIIGFWFLSKTGIKGGVLGAGFLLYLLSMLLTPGNSRELHAVDAILSGAGFIGIVLGIIDLFRNKGNKENLPQFSKGFRQPPKSKQPQIKLEWYDHIFIAWFLGAICAAFYTSSLIPIWVVGLLPLLGLGTSLIAKVKN